MMTANLRANIVANFLGNLLVGVLSLAVIPLYIKLIGSEGYGVIGFYATLQLLAFLLDFGLSATINREMARFISPNSPHNELRSLAHTIEVIYCGIGLVIAVTIGLASKIIATNWLTSASIPPEELQVITILMGVAMGFRWPFTLYSAGLLGLQKQVRQNVIFALMEVIRMVGALIILLLGYKVLVFFVWQALVSLLGTVCIYHHFWRIISLDGHHGEFDFSQVKKVGKFAGGMGGVGILVTILVQTDKVILSKMLTLSEFGQYMAVGTLASGLYLISRPIFSAHYPELTRLVADHDDAKERLVFQHGYQLLATLVVPLAVVLVTFSREIVEIWLGHGVSGDLYQVFSLLVLGTALNALVNMPYALQLAHGKASFGFKSNLVAVVVLIPATVVLTQNFGMRGAALAWVLLNAGYMFISIPIMSWMGLIKGGSWPFYRDGVLCSLIVSLVAALAAELLLGFFGGRSVGSIIAAVLFGLTTGVFFSMLALKETRTMVFAAAGYLKGL